MKERIWLHKTKFSIYNNSVRILISFRFVLHFMRIARYQCEFNRNTARPQNVILYSSRRTGVYQYYSSLFSPFKEKSIRFRKKTCVLGAREEKRILAW